jgi:hypothetical protein
MLRICMLDLGGVDERIPRSKEGEDQSKQESGTK